MILLIVKVWIFGGGWVVCVDRIVVRAAVLVADDVDIATEFVLLSVAALRLDDIVVYARTDEFAMIGAVPSL